MKNTAEEIKLICLRLLGQREHSKKELLNKLVLRGYEDADVSRVINDLSQQGFQDDFRYAENYARCRTEKGYGPIRIDYELRQRGVATAEIEDIMQKQAGNWIKQLELVYNKKYTQQVVSDRGEMEKRRRFLLQRGFSAAMINDLFKRLNSKTTMR